MNKFREIAAKTLKMCFEINEAGGKAIAFFNYSPHTKGIHVVIHKDGWVENTTSDINFDYYHKERKALKWSVKNGNFVQEKTDLLKELDMLLKEYRQGEPQNVQREILQ